MAQIVEMLPHLTNLFILLSIMLLLGILFISGGGGGKSV
jgi:hypothetical protein